MRGDGGRWISIVFPASSLAHGAAADECSEDGDGGEEGDPEEVGVALVVGAGDVALEEAGVEVFAAEGGGDGIGWQRGEVSEVIDGCAEVVVTITEGVGGVGDGVEAEGALAHL